MSKVFYTKFSEVSGQRLDPKYNDYITRYKVIQNNSVKLGSLLLRKPQYGANESAIDYNNNCRYIRITDIDEFGLLKNNGLKSAKNEEEQYKLKYNDVIIARSGATVGKAYIHQNKNLNAIFAGYMIRFKFDESKVNPAYIFYYTQLNIYKQWTEAIQRSAGQPNINAEEYQDLDIPIFSLDKQNKIVSLIEQAKQQKQQKEQEAKEKLGSIDDYLLNALGIDVPQKQDESIEDKVFSRKFSEVSGDRMDPTYYKNKFKKLLANIKKNNYNTLKNILNFSSETWDQKSIFGDTFPYIEISEIDIVSGNIKKINYVDTLKAPSRAKMIVRNNDIIVSTTRPDRGAISFVHTDSILIASTGFSIIRNVSDEIKKEFLFIILKSSIVLNQFSQRSSGGNYPAITQEEISKVIVPIPDAQMQNKIVTQINTLKDEVKTLKDEASQIYYKAKVEVEKMILGEIL